MYDPIATPQDSAGEHSPGPGRWSLGAKTEARYRCLREFVCCFPSPPPPRRGQWRSGRAGGIRCPMDSSHSWAWAWTRRQWFHGPSGSLLPTWHSDSEIADPLSPKSCCVGNNLHPRPEFGVAEFPSLEEDSDIDRASSGSSGEWMQHFHTASLVAALW